MRKKIYSLLMAFVMLTSCANVKYTTEVTAQKEKLKQFVEWRTANQPSEECKKETDTLHDKMAEIIKSQGKFILQMLGRKDG